MLNPILATLTTAAPVFTLAKKSIELYTDWRVGEALRILSILTHHG